LGLLGCHGAVAAEARHTLAMMNGRHAARSFACAGKYR
jgi:hypothetical protein